MATVKERPAIRLEAKSSSAGRWKVIGAGALAGLIAALAMTALMALTRLLLGVPSPSEMLGDVAIPSLSLDQFFQLIGRFDGGNGIKKVGISSVLIGQLVAGLLAGVVYGALSTPGRVGNVRRGTIFVVVAGLVAWLGTIIPLRAVLFTNYRGLPAGPAMALTAVALLLTYAFFGAVLVLAYRAMVGPRSTSREAEAPSGAPVGRRVVLVAGAGVVTAAVTGGLLRLLYGRSTLRYDCTRYRRPDLPPHTPNDRFYSVTKNVLDPDVARATWRLRVDGQVNIPRTYTFDELTALPTVTTQEATVSCISNDIGDGLASNAIWRGVPLRALLEAAGMQQPPA